MNSTCKEKLGNWWILLYCTLFLTLISPLSYYIVRCFSKAYASVVFSKVTSIYEVGMVFLYSLLTIVLTIRRVKKRLLTCEALFLIFLIWLGMSVFYAKSRTLFVHRYLLIFSSMGVFQVFMEATSLDERNLPFSKFYKYVAFSIVVMALITLGVTLLRLIYKGEFARLGFPYAHPNQIACLFAISIPLLLSVKKRNSNSYIDAAILVVFVSLMFTGSRGALMALLGGSFVVYILYKDQRREIRTGLVIIGLIGLALVITGVFIHKSVVATVLRLGSKNFVSFKYRYDTWLNSFQYLKGLTIFTGLGTGQFQMYISYPGSMHNQYLQILFENGIIGLGLFLALLLYPLVELLKLQRNILSKTDDGNYVYLIWSYLIFLFSFLTETRLKSFQMCFYFALLLSFLCFTVKSICIGNLKTDFENR